MSNCIFDMKAVGEISVRVGCVRYHPIDDDFHSKLFPII